MVYRGGNFKPFLCHLWRANLSIAADSATTVLKYQNGCNARSTPQLVAEVAGCGGLRITKFAVLARRIYLCGHFNSKRLKSGWNRNIQTLKIGLNFDNFNYRVVFF